MAATQPKSGEQFEAVSEAMGKKIREDREELRQVSEGIIASLDRANLGAHLEGVTRSTELERADFEVGDAEAIEEQLLGGTLEGGKNQVITAEAFWWGYHFVVPESAMKDFTKAGDVTASFMALGGAAIAASGGSLAPAVGVVAAYVAAELALMKAVDKGKGVYLSASWVSPGVIVPTPI